MLDRKGEGRQPGRPFRIRQRGETTAQAMSSADDLARLDPHPTGLNGVDAHDQFSKWRWSGLPAPEVGVAEGARIFEAEAEGAVEADMGDPDQGGRHNRRFAPDEAGESKRDSERVCVREVVDDGADSRPREIR